MLLLTVQTVCEKSLHLSLHKVTEDIFTIGIRRGRI